MGNPWKTPGSISYRASNKLDFSFLAFCEAGSILNLVDSQNTKRDSDRRAVDALYRISALSSKESNPMVSLERILDEVMGIFEASSASICLLNADSDKLLIEVEKGLSKASSDST